MSQNLRWTPDQLRAHLNKRLGPAAAAAHPALAAISQKGPTALERAILGSSSKGAFVEASVRSAAASPTPSRNFAVTHPASSPSPKQARASELPGAVLDKIIEKADGKAVKTRISQRERSINSLKAAHWSGAHVPGQHLEIRFHGVILLSVNTLYGLSHFQRVKYRKAWHELVESAIADIVGGASQRLAMNRYVIFAHRVSRRLADTDAKSGYLKYPIDGLRYSGILIEDTEAHFRDFFCTQSVGEPALVIRIEAVADDYVPVAMRNPWAQRIEQEFAASAKPAQKDKQLADQP